MPSTAPPPGFSGGTWDSLPVQERAVQWAAYYADTLKVRELPTNRGFWVERFLAYCGLGAGYAWCAAFVSECLKDAGWTKFKSAAVLKWRDWAEDSACDFGKPVRGALGYWVRSSGRHIEIVLAAEGEWCPTSVHESGKVPKGFVHTIGGNTSIGVNGSQNDGDGVYRRLRPVGNFDGFIRWWMQV